MHDGSPGPSFDRVAAVWRRRRWLAASVFALAAAAGITAALSLPPVYRATATVIVDQARTDPATASDLESRLQLIGQQLFSRSPLQTLLDRFDLYPELRRAGLREAALAQLRRDIVTESKVQPQPSGVGATLALAISYRGPDPEVVAQVANALAALYIEEERSIRGRQASGAVQVLTGHLEDVKQRLKAQESALAEYQQDHMGELSEHSEANLAHLQRLHADLRTASEERIRAIERRTDLTRRLAEAEAAAAATPAGVRPGPAAEKLARKREELAEMRRRYSDKYPDLIRLQDEVAALEREAAAPPDPGPAAASVPRATTASLREAVREVEAEISGLRADEARLRDEISGRIRRLEDTPRQQRGYQEIARDYQTTRDLYDSLRKRYEQAALEDADGRPDHSPFRILDSAVVPTNPAAPNRLLLLAAALFGALVLAAAAAALAERLDGSLHTPDEVRAFTRVPVVATIPLIVTAGDRRAAWFRASLAALSVTLAVGLVVRAVHHAARTQVGLVLMLAKGRP